MSPSTAPSPTTNPLVGLYRACGTIGNLGLPGAPIAYYSLLVDAVRGTLTGIVHITQAIEGPASDVHVNVTGTIHKLVWGPDVTTTVLLAGDYTQPCPPPQMCISTYKFAAHMVLNNDWNGMGGFEYGLNTRIENVPVKSSDCDAA
jgi:hypothetical protein